MSDRIALAQKAAAAHKRTAQVARLIESAPPLKPEQLAHLTALLAQHAVSDYRKQRDDQATT
jgi:hypothetical protein